VPAQIGDALGRLLGDATLRTRLGAAGRAREASFTWAATAAGTLESYARAWAARRGRSTL
jgi:hypothetical protein